MIKYHIITEYSTCKKGYRKHNNHQVTVINNIAYNCTIIQQERPEMSNVSNIQ
jgi:hypothetical protein